VKALSVRQPWAWLIVARFKDIENRTWTLGLGGRSTLVIHASKVHDKLGEAWVRRQFPHIEIPAGLAHGALVGRVNLAGWCRDHSSPWAEAGMWHWILANPVQFRTPEPWKGQLGLFNVPDDLIRKLSQ